MPVNREGHLIPRNPDQKESEKMSVGANEQTGICVVLAACGYRASHRIFGYGALAVPTSIDALSSADLAFASATEGREISLYRSPGVEKQACMRLGP